MTERIPAQIFHPWDFIAEELEAREWTVDDLALRMGGDFAVNRLSLDFLEGREPGLHIGEESAEQLARAFGTSAQLWINLDKQWHDAINRQESREGHGRD